MIFFLLGVTLTGRAFRLNRKGFRPDFLTKKAASSSRLFFCRKFLGRNLLTITCSNPLRSTNGNLQKDKSSARKRSGVLPEKATRFSDVADKIVWTKYGKKLKNKCGNFVTAKQAWGIDKFVFLPSKI